MANPRATRIQLCGRLVVELCGRRVEDALPGAKGRLLFAFLVLNRDRRMSRDELLTAVYGEEASPDQQPSLSVLLSKLRGVIGREFLAGRSEIELVLPPDAFVDVEAAREALHRAESHVAAGKWAESWGPAGVAYHVSRRPLLQGEDRPWLDEWRRRLDDLHLRGLECFAQARLGLGGPTLPQAEDAARRLIELAPYRETGHQILIEALERRGNVAEALLAYDRLRVLLRKELGVAPSPSMQSVHRRLLGERTMTSAWESPPPAQGGRRERPSRRDRDGPAADGLARSARARRHPRP
jgi:DNA-binding SARP family transcriptional activator